MKHLVATASLILVFAGAGFAQESTGSLLGTVRDQAAAEVPAATVEITSTALGRTLKATTNQRGEYVFPSLPPGDYTVTATHTGFAAARAVGVPLALGRVMRVDLKLEVSPLAEKAAVATEVPLIDVISSTSAINVGQKEIDLEAKGRSFQGLAALAPGAQQEPKNGLQVDGASGAENFWIIDGVDTTSVVRGDSAKNLPVEWVQELQVKSSGFEAEYGGALGGVVNVISRSGTNSVHGELNYYYWGSKLRTDPRPRLRINPVDNKTAEYLHDPKDKNANNEAGFNLGGPILKDKMWYFLGYQPWLASTSRNVYFPTYKTTRSFTQTQSTQNWIAKLSLQPWDRLRANLGIIAGASKLLGGLPSYDGTDNPDAGFERLGWRTPNVSYNGDVYLRATTKLFFTSRVGYFLEDEHVVGVPNQVMYYFQGTPANYWNQLAPEFRQQRGWTNIATNQVEKYNTRTRLTGSFDGNWFATFLGDHSLKFGYTVNRLHQRINNTNQADVLTFYFDTTWENVTAPGTSTKGKYGYYTRQEIGNLGDVHSYNHGLFVQDSWTLGRRLRLNVGMRTEHENVPSFRTDMGIKQDAFVFPLSQKLAPRLGAAYDLFGNGRTKLYGSFGLYYDLMKYSLSQNSLGGYVNLRWYYALDTLDIGSIGNGNYPGALGEKMDNAYPSNAPQDPKRYPASILDLGGRNLIDPDLKPMRSREYTVGLDRMLGNNWVINLRYARKRLDRAVEDNGVLLLPTGYAFFITNPGLGISKRFYGPGCDPQYGGGADCAKFLPYPTARRRYDGFEVRAQRRFARNWQGAFSYTLSHLTGNYGGLAASDWNYAVVPNNTRLFDVPFNMVTAAGKYDDGPLATDRLHSFKAYGSYSIPIKGQQFTIGGVFSAGSGIPFWRDAQVATSAPMKLEGRSSEGRKAAFTLTSLYFAQEFKSSERTRLRLDFTLENAFDQATPANYNTSYARGRLAAGTPGSPVTDNWMFTRGFDYKQQIRLQANYQRPASCGSFEQDPYCPAARLSLNPTFMKPTTFLAPLAGRLGIRFIF